MSNIKENELSALLKYLKNTLENDDRKGIKINGYSMSKKTALANFSKLETHFGITGALSLGICQDCDCWSLKGHGSKALGTCPITRSDQQSCYSSCYKFKGETVR